VIFENIIKFVEEKFELAVEYEKSVNLLLIRIPGIDNVSLGKWIKQYFTEVEVTTKEVEGYKILSNGWIKIEKCGS
jgi:hypothetical protein